MTSDDVWPVSSLSPDDRIKQYAQLYANNDGEEFENTLVHYRQRSILEYLRQRKPQNIVEIGCGLDLLVMAAKNLGIEFDTWTIFEPASQFVAAAQEKIDGVKNVKILQEFFESTNADVKWPINKADLVIISCLLHELDNPDAVLVRAFDILKPEGRVYAVVPNASSLHRRLAVAMGLIDKLSVPSERNLRMMQRRIFDRASLISLFNKNNFEVVETGGLFLKPFTHRQMTLCASHLPTDVMTGLWRLGQDLPELASEIFVEAKKRMPPFCNAS